LPRYTGKMRFQLFLLCGLACAYATGAYYTSHQAVDVSHASAPVNHQGVSADGLREGDILFQTSNSEVSRAIQLATHSKYSHCGVLLYESGQPYVYEAVQPVSKTPLENWTSGHYVAKRLKNADKALTPDALAKMKAEVKKFYGKDYDIYFDWDDDQLYCSELVYKVYERGAGVKVGEIRQLKDYDLSNELVKKHLQLRYGNALPLEESMISPGAIFDSGLLQTVSEK
jgi:hypothetical protein